LPTNRRIGPIRRRAVSAAGVIAALAIAAPVAEASAATPRAVPFSFFGPWAGAALAIGPTVIGDAFNGGTTVVVSTAPAVGTTNFSP
jgi:hypothetical protein